jgi:hypothetical protein
MQGDAQNLLLPGSSQVEDTLNILHCFNNISVQAFVDIVWNENKIYNLQI